MDILCPGFGRILLLRRVLTVAMMMTMMMTMIVSKIKKQELMEGVITISRSMNNFRMKIKIISFKFINEDVYDDDLAKKSSIQLENEEL